MTYYYITFTLNRFMSVCPAVLIYNVKLLCFSF